MAYNANPYEAYNHANETKSHTEQIIMLYNGAISFVKQAKEAHEQNDHEKCYNLINKTIAIIRGLRACLDFDAAEDAAKALNQYYEDLDTMLVAVQCEDNKSQICSKIINNLRIIKEGWEKVDPEPKLEFTKNELSADAIPPVDTNYESRDFSV